MARLSKREADAISARVDIALARLAQTRAITDQAVTAEQRRLWNQLGAYHRLKLKKQRPDLYARLS